MKSEKGSILISTLLFISITAILISGLASIIQTQVIQLKQVQYSYQARSMLSMTETLVLDEIEKNSKLQKGKIIFNNGVVEINKRTESILILTATLDDNDYMMNSQIDIEPRNDERTTE